LRFPLGSGFASGLSLLLAASALSTASCEALWGSLSRDNPANCVRSGQPCGADETCDSASQVCVSALQLDSVTPALASSSGGTAMVLRGQRLQSGARVLVDGQVASDVEVRSESELSFRLPASPRGLWRVAVAVENPSGHRSERSDLFSYFSPSLSMLGRPITIGGQATLGAVGDWNGDQKPDLAILASPTPGVQLFEGDGQGGLSSSQSVSVGSAQMFTTQLAVLDANLDSKPDLAVVAGAAVTLLYGDGRGGFPTRRTVYTATTGRYVSALSVADYDGDGRADLAIADSMTDNSSSNVLLLLADADGSYRASTAIDSGPPPRVLLLSDLTADGKPDLLVGIRDVRLTLWRNDGGAARSQFDVPVAGCSVSAVAAGDLNRDGRADLLLNCTTGLRTLLGQDAGQFVAKPDFLSSPATGTDIVVADLNGDGWLDGVVGRYTSQGDGEVVGLLGDGAGGFAAPQSLTSYPGTNLMTGHDLAVADWDGDGKPDVLSLTPSGRPTCQVLLNRSP